MQQKQIKKCKGTDTSSFGKKDDLANLKSNVDKLDIDKLNNVPNNYRNMKTKVNKVDVDKSVFFTVDLSKLSDVVKIMSLKKMRKMLR